MNQFVPLPNRGRHQLQLVPEPKSSAIQAHRYGSITAINDAHQLSFYYF